MKSLPKLPALLSVAIIAAITIVGCSLDALLHSTASLGGNIAGQRGSAQVLFINNTPYRAIFTFGTYDELDHDTVPQLTQFSSNERTENLEGNSQVGPLDIECARVFSIGGEGLVTRVLNNLDQEDYENTPLVDGVYFSSANVGSDDADAATEGTAAGVDSLIGADFDCGSLIIYRFEVNDLGPEEFKIEMSVIPAESNRG